MKNKAEKPEMKVVWMYKVPTSPEEVAAEQEAISRTFAILFDETLKKLRANGHPNLFKNFMD